MVDVCDTLSKPIGTGIGVEPFRARLKKQLAISTGFFKTRRLCREVQNGYLVDPAGFPVALGRSRKRLMEFCGLICPIDLVVDFKSYRFFSSPQDITSLPWRMMQPEPPPVSA
jgi:hypothetical protein